MSFPDPRTSLRLPSGFEEILYAMAREVLRAQPDDVLGFITRYFQALLAERERNSAARRTGQNEVPPSGAVMEQQEAATKIQAAFRGYSTRKDLRGVRRAHSDPPRPASDPRDCL